MGQECSICTGPPERLAEVNALLADNFNYRKIADITTLSKSSVARHAQEEETKTIIATLRTGATPDEASSLTAWTENLAMAREKGDSTSAIRAQRELDKIRSRIGERKEQSKPRRGPSNVHPTKETWKLCRQCLWSEMLGENALPGCSTEAYRIQLSARAMAWITTESTQAKPEWDVIATLSFAAVELIRNPWPQEYQAAIETFRAAVLAFQPAVMAFATEVRRIEAELQKAVQDV